MSSNTGKVKYYNYSKSGNVSYYEYDFVSGLYVNLETSGHSYGSGTDWKEMLTSYGGTPITYDANGNPLSYYNGQSYTFTWQKGRQLASAVTGTDTITYAYDVNGRRISKTVNGTTHTYTYDGMLLLCDMWDDKYIEYFYDSSGSPYALNYYDGTTSAKYFFIKNLEGDILELKTSTNVLVARYIYDGWGKILEVRDIMGYAITDQTHIANLNSLRYRGYVYDTETKLYYLQSRYYDPQTERFISPDSVDYLGYNSDLAGYNMYSYCGNNPIVRADYNGEWWIIIVVIVVCTFVLFAGCSNQKQNNYGNAYSYNDLKIEGGVTSPNCYAYALGCNKSMQPGGASGKQLNTRAKYSINDLVTSVKRDLKALGRGCRELTSINGKINHDEYRIAVRHGKRMYIFDKVSGNYKYVKVGGSYDYHFMVQLNDGTWSEKHGIGGDSIHHELGATPNTLSWDLGNLIGYYDSDIRYLAITR